jgi:isocitrate/isopropylmalate dehydrogenase
MDITKFKKIIKESVREVIQEELRDILLEAVKAPKTVVTETVHPNTYTQPHVSQPKQLNAAERRAMFGNILEDMQGGGMATSNNIPFTPSGPIDPVNGKLPEGELGLDQIMGLMNK